MQECPSCHNLIPKDMKICPHCGKLPPKLFPQFAVYLALTVVAFLAAFYFRPFMNPAMAAQLSTAMMWISFVIFIVFGIIFLAVSFVIWKDYSRRSFRGHLSSAEVQRFVNMRQHIETEHHFYRAGDKYCSVCGKKKE